MNKIIRILSAVFLTVASSPSFAGTNFIAPIEMLKIGDKVDEGYDRSNEVTLLSIFNNLKGNRVVIQFNVRSTNKSPYNAVYLDTPGRFFDVGGYYCDPVEHNSGGTSDFSGEDVIGDVPNEPVLVTYLPYSPHKEVHNDVEWPNGWRSVHAVVHVPEWLHQDQVVLRVCSRDKDGDVAGDLDDFEIKDIVIHYETEDKVQ